MNIFIIAFLASILFATTAHSHGGHNHGSAEQLAPQNQGTGPDVHLYREASCSCCKKWGKIMVKNGYNVIDHVSDNMQVLKQQEGIADELSSCHTAFVGGYFIEGHVPVASINKILNDMPDLAGLTVPGMPLGSPGMDVPQADAEKYSVIAVSNDGSTSVYDTYLGSDRQATIQSSIQVSENL